MPEACLKFNLPEEKDEHKMAIRGADYFCFLWDLHNAVRSALKHGHNHKTVDKVYEWLRDELAEVQIWDIS